MSLQFQGWISPLILPKSQERLKNEDSDNRHGVPLVSCMYTYKLCVCVCVCTCTCYGEVMDKLNLLKPLFRNTTFFLKDFCKGKYMIHFSRFARRISVTWIFGKDLACKMKSWQQQRKKYTKRSTRKRIPWSPLRKKPPWTQCKKGDFLI